MFRYTIYLKISNNRFSIFPVLLADSRVFAQASAFVLNSRSLRERGAATLQFAVCRCYLPGSVCRSLPAAASPPRASRTIFILIF
ncbi:hypothetical protein [Methanimicrococcus stummii]|uniref:hypothetical protein n=1 Tax=Methanimicrococcus stummii TaxID=3028294 RepID=UPI0029316898|nr:hypothetical protein [Methanimicrococcus sp. Es2]